MFMDRIFRTRGGGVAGPAGARGTPETPDRDRLREEGVRALRALDDHMLADLGIGRDQIEAYVEAGLPDPAGTGRSGREPATGTVTGTVTGAEPAAGR